MNERGFTLLEGVLALAIVSVALTGIMPSFVNFMDVTTRNEERSAAIALTQLRMETTRQLDPLSMPTSGSSTPEYIEVDGREYEVTLAYCVIPEYCTTSSRHITVEVRYGGEIVYAAESVFTALR